ncbi:transcription termination factor MTERF6, chloroplastic/mitochondrial-like [Cornus florida]|uniref:transcription termination factor MTERF6, chloroplastic/mitochondrial-like n=1 Tax=Cornus florida TaxID=4283 RepID=UPI00289F9FE7|nr:transcription termination factor MTERF6, chloroplastic/mitochondrial-like [Cornus florida]
MRLKFSLRAPVVFALSERKINEITQLLLSTGKCDISYVVNYPTLLTFSVENRLKPRLRVLEVLESRNLILKRRLLRLESRNLILKRCATVAESLAEFEKGLIQLWRHQAEGETPIAVVDYLIDRHKFSPETTSKVSEKYLENPEVAHSILSFLQESGFSDTHLERVIKYAPQLLSANLERSIKPKFKLFRDLGFSSSDVVEIVSSNPRILTSSVDNRLGPSILALKSVLGSSMDDVSRVLKKRGWFSRYDLAKTMIPNIEFIIKSCGMSSTQYVYKFPRVFMCKPTQIRECVKRVDEMGIDRKSKMFLPAIRAIRSMSIENWELKLEVFKSLGFSEDDILSVFRRAPQVFTLSERKIKAKTQFLLSTGKCDISYVINNPFLLTLSVENRLKPRLRVLEVLESRSLLLKKSSLWTVCRMSDEKFFEKYVLPYSDEVGELFVVNKV